MFGPSHAVVPEHAVFGVPHPLQIRGRRGRPGAGWHPRPCAEKLARDAQGKQVKPEHPGLPPRSGSMPYTYSPWRRIPFASITSRIRSDNEPVGPLVTSAKLDRSDDGQVHTISTYASSIVRPAMRAAHEFK